ncbi:Ivy family c-type lysozyme inhibitor [Acinetobacter sp. MD2(2019)]|uniref:Ivy family c-type lysozyme inhibitor n=1 Tax=Acinetobacter sp. MD2(2019) TaxID=2605273 RepID=UPI002D1EA317|nr:Ivy family c-type lysozyme inhibitor [Acinetobacter sp. MD2(2019)]MEB3753073.1 C-lysozyme inhibitor [Acinetobacter sp. MD2(2019)]
MKKTILFTLVASALMTTVAQAEALKTLNSDKVAQAQFKKISNHKNLPAWTKTDGTTSATKTVKIAGKNYLVFGSCKPHDCSSEQIATIYAPQSKAMTSVYSRFNEKNSTQQLKWMSNQPDISIEEKTILLSALTGALDNYPQKFNF